MQQRLPTNTLSHPHTTHILPHTHILPNTTHILLHLSTLTHTHTHPPTPTYTHTHPPTPSHTYWTDSLLSTMTKTSVENTSSNSHTQTNNTSCKKWTSLLTKSFIPQLAHNTSGQRWVNRNIPYWPTRHFPATGELIFDCFYSPTWNLLFSSFVQR